RSLAAITVGDRDGVRRGGGYVGEHGRLATAAAVAPRVGRVACTGVKRGVAAAAYGGRAGDCRCRQRVYRHRVRIRSLAAIRVGDRDGVRRGGGYVGEHGRLATAAAVAPRVGRVACTGVKRGVAAAAYGGRAADGRRGQRVDRHRVGVRSLAAITVRDRDGVRRGRGYVREHGRLAAAAAVRPDVGRVASASVERGVAATAYGGRAGDCRCRQRVDRHRVHVRALATITVRDRDGVCRGCGYVGEHGRLAAAAAVRPDVGRVASASIERGIAAAAYRGRAADCWGQVSAHGDRVRVRSLATITVGDGDGVRRGRGDVGEHGRLAVAAAVRPDVG
ncbi:MAG: hypothetical protein ABL869_07730, partial [Candidatus Nitrotoga sp.]